MLLVIDVGNTNTVLGLFRGEDLVATWRVATDARFTADQYGALFLTLFPNAGVRPAEMTGIMLASVVPPLSPVLVQACQRYLGRSPLVLRAGIKTGVRIITDNPREVGADRIANAAAVHRLYGGPAIVVDFGTATTFDVVSREGDYLGGAIAPGIEIARRALFQYAAQLPLVELARPRQAVGRNTVASMQSGILFGYVGLVEGLVARIQRELDAAARVLATGGLASVVAAETAVIELVDLDLTLKGLRIIYELNGES